MNKRTEEDVHPSDMHIFYKYNRYDTCREYQRACFIPYVERDGKPKVPTDALNMFYGYVHDELTDEEFK